MKNYQSSFFLILSFSLFLLPISVFALGWNLQYQEPGHHTLYSVKFVDTNYGWVVGDSGIVLHTANGGGDWEYQASPTSHVLRSVAFVDASYGFAVGDTGTIIATTNGGVNWTNQTSNTIQMLRSVSFVNASRGWAVGDSGMILCTSDGGENWLPQTSGTPYALNSVCFVDVNNGWVVGGYFVYPDTSNIHSIILHSSDGGISWISQNSGTISPLYGVTFVDPNRGWGVGSYYVLPDSLTSFCAILNTINGGITWNIQYGGIATNSVVGVTSLDFNHIWIVDRFANFGYTNNGGVTWNGESADPSYERTSLSMVDTTHGWAVGELGTIFLYTGYTFVANNNEVLPDQFQLNQNYPNPFNSSTLIQYSIPTYGSVQLDLFDGLGRNVRTLLNEPQRPGVYQVSVNGMNLSSGTYFYRLSNGNQTMTRKMILLK